jgi:deoxyribonucleoside regulator
VDDETAGLLTSVARMYYLDDLEQREIAEILGVSRSKVSRLLTAARERGIVRISVAPYDPRDRDLERRLIERFGIRRAVVVRTPSAAAEHVRRTIGYFAAPAIAELIRPRMTIGVTGGRTLGQLLGFLQPADRRSDLTIVQLMGQIDPTASRMDSPELCRTLADRCGGAVFTLNAPAFVQDRQARDVFLAHQHMKLVWALFGRIDLALVGIGSLEESAFVERGVLDRALAAELRAAGAVGEICGRFYDRAGRECDTPQRERTVGMELEELRRRPEVIGVTHGPGRAAAARAALGAALINGIVIDHLGAEAILADEGSGVVSQESEGREGPPVG